MTHQPSSELEQPTSLNPSLSADLMRVLGLMNMLHLPVRTQEEPGGAREELGGARTSKEESGVGGGGRMRSPQPNQGAEPNCYMQSWHC